MLAHGAEFCFFCAAAPSIGKATSSPPDRRLLGAPISPSILPSVLFPPFPPLGECTGKDSWHDALRDLCAVTSQGSGILARLIQAARLATLAYLRALVLLQ
eukprot:8651695-Pyramimonas_sp.AAC.1